MKLVSYTLGGEAGYGLVDEAAQAIVPVTGALRETYPTIRAALAGGGLAELAEALAGHAPSIGLSDIRYLPPLYDAEKVLCIGVNYPKRHPVQGDIPPPENISMFSKIAGSLVGHQEPLIQPPGEAARSFDYEGELVLVFGREGRHIPKQDAFDYIAGYTILNDGSVRDWQKHSVAAGKNFDSASSCGPWFVTADEIDDPFAMTLSTRLNGERVQHTTAGQMIFDIPTLVSYVSTFLHLKPGDILSTGSPEGSGGSRIPQCFLKAGDELEFEWSGIGVLKNQVVAA